jgi:hypothetical protein
MKAAHSIRAGCRNVVCPKAGKTTTDEVSQNWALQRQGRRVMDDAVPLLAVGDQRPSICSGTVQTRLLWVGGALRHKSSICHEPRTHRIWVLAWQRVT